MCLTIQTRCLQETKLVIFINILITINHHHHLNHFVDIQDERLLINTDFIPHCCFESITYMHTGVHYMSCWTSKGHNIPVLTEPFLSLGFKSFVEPSYDVIDLFLGTIMYFMWWRL